MASVSTSTAGLFTTAVWAFTRTEEVEAEFAGSDDCKLVNLLETDGEAIGL